jgi:hypothetical protein
MNYLKITKQWVAITFSLIVHLCLITQVNANDFDATFPYKDNNYTANPTINV